MSDISPPAVWRSEMVKLTSLRSTTTLACATIAASVLVSGLVSRAHSSRPNASDSSTDPVVGSLSGIVLAELLIAILGALAATSDYSSNTVRLSLIASPRRTRLLTAKLGACATLIGAVALAAVAGSILVSQWFLHGTDAALTTSTPHLPRALLGAVAYLFGWGLAGFGTGLAVRRTAPAVGIVVILLWILPAVLSVYDLTLANYVAPSATGQELLTTTAPTPGEPSLLVAALSFTCFVALCLAAGRQSFQRDT